MIKSKDISNALLRTIFILLGILICGYFLFSISSIIIYVITAILLSFVAEPICFFLQKRFKFNRTVAIVCSLVFFILIIFGIIMLFVPLILGQSKNLSLLDINSLEKNYTVFIDNVDISLQEYGINYEKYFNVQKITQSFNFNFITDILNSIIGSIGNFGMALFSIFFICFFILNDQKLVTDNLRAVLPDNNRWRIIASLLRIKNMLAKYAIGLLLQLLIVFILYLIVLLIFGVENAFIIALLGAILNIIPYIGPIIALVMTAFLTMLGHINEDFQTVVLPTTLYVIIGYFIVQLIDNNFSQPIIFSKSTNSHPLEIFLVTIISGTLLGIVGMIVAVPLYTAAKVVLKEFYPKNTFIEILTRGL
ncbi:AI-2E family transporter [Flavobacterium sp. F372]|uniref:AI-2E family transporter n=1 Tax=Flavobacterium bernardetii TaxID=2813823 RepID=A0ABR7IWL8_9FLAO|nr:AI-2E family transporter [Flavobacterium bernardetii]MBC5834189.1 AI-2E family transporter [Flavobacterium bernardetii]NHF69421.1 AI-2E family transporter [Flavobacterium bernardetii]